MFSEVLRIISSPLFDLITIQGKCVLKSALQPALCDIIKGNLAYASVSDHAFHQVPPGPPSKIVCLSNKCEKLFSVQIQFKQGPNSS